MPVCLFYCKSVKYLLYISRKINEMTRIGIVSVLILFQIISVQEIIAQKDKLWTLQECIEYALKENIQVRQSYLNVQNQIVSEKLARAQRFPDVRASVSQNFAWSKTENSSDFSSNNNTNYSLNAGVSLFNGFRITSSIRQAMINHQASEYDAETQKESVSLSIMDAYLQVLYANEQVKNAENQVETTKTQLQLAEERLNLRSIALSDYLQVKSQLASEKQNLASALTQLTLARLNLMQLMEIQVNDTFNIVFPEVDSLINTATYPDADSVFRLALSIKPQIQSAKLRKESSAMEVVIAKGSLFPSLSLNAGIGTGYSSEFSGMSYSKQLDQRISPSVGLSLSIPIYQKREAISRIEPARIGVERATLDELNTMNQLRKNIEQACADVSSAQKEYEAGLEGYNASLESYRVTEEKFNQGIISSVDFLIQKTNLIQAESKLLQAKYNLLFSQKVLDFYMGKSLIL